MRQYTRCSRQTPDTTKRDSDPENGVEADEHPFAITDDNRVDGAGLRMILPQPVAMRARQRCEPQFPFRIVSERPKHKPVAERAQAVVVDDHLRECS